jgi:membrane associated rhomboid family serine protease
VVTVSTLLIGDRPVAGTLLLAPEDVLHHLKLWPLLSANFLHAGGALSGLVGTSLVQLVCGTALEGRWGTGRYLAFAVGCGVLGHTLAAVAGLWLSPRLAMGGAAAMDAAAAVGAVVALGDVQARVPGLGRTMSVVPLALFLWAGVVALPLFAGGSWPVVLPGLGASIVALALAFAFRRGFGPRNHGAPADGRSRLRVLPSEERRLN